ncbi:hypothetical protein [Microbacterium sp.]|uniref:hypothetical protein n=1 Tax=Microbacterium sp. TaxID=51671 RepID=UPI0039E6E375
MGVHVELIAEWGDQAEITAEHEAAHAVAYLALGYPVHVCDAVAGFTAQAAEPVRMDVLHHAVVNMAGVVIENRYAFMSVDDRLTAAAGDDPEDAGDIGRVMPGLANYGYGYAEVLLEQHREDWRVIADALLERGRLDAADIALLPLKLHGLEVTG